MTHTFEVTLTGYISIDAANEDEAREILDRDLMADPDGFTQRNFIASGDQSKMTAWLLPDPAVR
jgi:hypothetical protein